jgi:hypothetical protein
VVVVGGGGVLGASNTDEDETQFGSIQRGFTIKLSFSHLYSFFSLASSSLLTNVFMRFLLLPI